MEARADRGRTFAWSQDHFDAPLVGTETGVLIDKTSEVMAAGQDRGQCHDGESCTTDRRRTRPRIFVKAWADRRICRRRRVDSDDTGTEVRGGGDNPSSCSVDGSLWATPFGQNIASHDLWPNRELSR